MFVHGLLCYVSLFDRILVGSGAALVRNVILRSNRNCMLSLSGFDVTFFVSFKLTFCVMFQ